jgi:uncharacterized delta-60 repeat protein
MEKRYLDLTCTSFFAGFILLLSILATGFTGAEQASSGVLNLSFNEPNGYALWHTPDASQDRSLEMAIQSDGKIILGGYTNNTKTKDILLLRYLPNGTPDPSFGVGGAVIYAGAAGKDDYGFGIIIDPEGKILVAGREHNGRNADMLILRCNPDGTPDTTFGENGTVRYAGPANGTDSARGVVFQKDGKIVITGEMNVSSHKELIAIRYNPDGTLDTDYGSSGIFTLNTTGKNDSYGFGIALDEEERAIITGGVPDGGKEGIGTIRLLPNGTLDRTFASNGIAAYHGKKGGPDYGNWISIQPDGKIVVTGVETAEDGLFDIIVLRYNSDGTPDSAFGTEGVAGYKNPGYDYAWGDTLMDDGSIVIAGTTTLNGLETPVLITFFKDGSPNESVGKNGVFSLETVGIGPLYAVKKDAYGDLLASGYITEDGTDISLLLKFKGN